MLYELGIENFKPFGNFQTAPLSKINLVYGPNSSGKSSLIQALMLLRQTFEAEGLRSAGLIARGRYVDLGSFRSLIHRHDTTRTLSVTLGYDRVASQRVGALTLPRDESRRTTLSFRALGTKRQRKDASELASVRYELDEGRLLDAKLVRVGELASSLEADSGAPSRAPFRWEDEKSLRSYAEYLRHFEARRSDSKARSSSSQGTLAGTPPPEYDIDRAAGSLKSTFAVGWGLLPIRLVPASHDEPGELVTHRFRQSQPLERLANELNALLNSVVYLGPLRSHPARHYLVTGGPADTVGVNGENTPQVIYRAPKQISKDINSWLERCEIPYRMKVKPIGDELTGEIIALHLTDARNKLQVGPSDVGFGIGQLLPIIVQGLVSPQRLVCVEQPEIHLHPKLQAHVADFLIETSGALPAPTAGFRVPRTQWIVETHSEAIVLRIQRRIRERVLAPEHVSVLYVQPTEDGRSRILRLRLGQDGSFLDEWPSGFFEERFDEMFAEGEA